jgi:nitrite reductase (NADH) small subunit
LDAGRATQQHAGASWRNWEALNSRRANLKCRQISRRRPIRSAVCRFIARVCSTLRASTVASAGFAGMLFAMIWVSLCNLDELKEGEGKSVAVNGFQLAVFLENGKPYVLDNRCPHAGTSISGGHVENHCAVCPWHQWAFDLDSGELAGRPLVKINSYPVRLLPRDGEPTLVQAELPIY